MTAVLQVENLTLHFGMITAAEGENVLVNQGEFVGIVGPNGAGKTTFLNLVTGYLKPEAGHIRFMGQDIVGLHPNQVTALGVGRSFQIPQLFTSLTVLENVLIARSTATGSSGDFWHALKRKCRIQEARAILAQFGLEAQADRPASELPEGGRKLLDIALAFALKPKLLLMDEPTSGVSVEDKFEVMDRLVKVLEESQVTAMFVEHDMEVVRRYAKRVLVINGGRIIADGQPEAILSHPEIRRAVAGWG
uniref:Branched-chain amino acid transport system ATP-binding protein n=1 Tax=uncultured prokaryote TaxID=198431 RepID=H5SIP3_9ZZZZ|nr:branched-chain amino acid transport system ATP-binding protein [uncultured prokaryote]